MTDKPFDYQTAFSRNIGWVTREEQDTLKCKRIAIAGLGGVGGSHLLTLARLGVGKFNISDFDQFELPNFNRQAGATISHLDQAKVDVLAKMALDINPSLELKKFPLGVNSDNLAEFFAGVDVYVDGLDFFAFEAREMVFAYCAEHGIPAITAAPLGMGAALINFLPGQMSFEAYFQLNGKSEADKILNFMLGLSPAVLQRSYLVDPNALDLINHKGPSTSVACELCAGLAAAQVLKIVLKRGKVLAAPWGLHFDAYRNKYVKTWRPWGNSNPIQRIAMHFARKQLIAKLPD